jgi:hypothetical protein
VLSGEYLAGEEEEREEDNDVWHRVVHLPWRHLQPLTSAEGEEEDDSANTEAGSTARRHFQRLLSASFPPTRGTRCPR